LAYALAELSARLAPVDASRICRDAAQTLVGAIDHETSVSSRPDLSWGLKELSSRLEPADATRYGREAAHVLTEALHSAQKHESRCHLASALTAVSGWLEPDVASRVLAEVLSRVVDEDSQYGEVSDGDESSSDARESLAANLAEVSARLAPADAARVCGGPAESMAEKLQKVADGNARTILAKSLASVSARLAPADAARLCGGATRAIAEARGREKNGILRSQLAGGLPELTALLTQMDAAEAARALSKSMTHLDGMYTEQKYLNLLTDRLAPRDALLILNEALERAPGHIHGHETLAEGLVATSAKLHAAEGVRVLAEALRRESDPVAMERLASALAEISARLEPAESTQAQVCREAARALAVSVGRDRQVGIVGLDPIVQSSLRARATSYLARGLTALSTRLEPVEYTRLCSGAIRTLVDEWINSYCDSSYCDSGKSWQKSQAHGQFEFVHGHFELLAELSARMEPNESCQVTRGAIRALLRKRSAFLDDKIVARAADMDLSRLLGAVDQPWSRLLAGELAARTDLGRGAVPNDVEMDGTINYSFLSDALDLLLTDNGRIASTLRRARLLTITAVVGPVTAALLSAAQPLPCRLTTQELVELLKMPTCFGEGRQAVLKHLGNRFGRRFANHWEFVRFAQDKGLDLDFTTPPKRPDPRVSLEHLLDEPVAEPSPTSQ
jgi:hypothetical protein